MSSPEKKKRRRANNKRSIKESPVLPLTTTESTPNPSLPDDLLLSCFARLSRLYYPTVSLVSKRSGSLLTSPELYKARSLLNRTESCLYVCLELSPDSNPRWFTLCRKPDQTLSNHTSKKKNKKSSGYVLAPIRIPHSPPAHWSGVVSVGSNIYNIGGPINDSASANVSVLDCQSHTWHEAPSMRVERNYPFANVCDGKIYVAGGCKSCNDSNLMEVFDPKTQIWEPVLSPLANRCKSGIGRSAVIEGGIYMFGSHGGLAYKTKEDKWEAVGYNDLELGWGMISYCVIDDVIYCYNLLRGITWYDSKIRYWMELKGLIGLPKFAGYCLVKLVDYGGKMVVLWDKFLPSSGYKKKTFWCAVIALERRNNDEEIWGVVEWFDVVLTVPISYKYVCSVAATV